MGRIVSPHKECIYPKIGNLHSDSVVRSLDGTCVAEGTPIHALWHSRYHSMMQEVLVTEITFLEMSNQFDTYMKIVGGVDHDTCNKQTVRVN